MRDFSEGRYPPSGGSNVPGTRLTLLPADYEMIVTRAVERILCPDFMAHLVREVIRELDKRAENDNAE